MVSTTEEQPPQGVAGGGDVDASVPVGVGSRQTWRVAATEEEPVEDAQRIGYIDAAIDIYIAAAKLGEAKVLLCVAGPVADLLGDSVLL